MSLEEIIDGRKNKLQKLKEAEKNPYPVKVAKDYTIKEIIESFSKFSRRRKKISLVGRVMALRGHGGLIFCDFSDGSFIEEKEIKNAVLQGYIKKDILGVKDFNLFKETVDIGDFLELKGTLFFTKKREKSIKVSSLKVISKSLRPLPEKWHGLSDVEERFRKRYLDILMNEEVKARFILRSKIISEIRIFLGKKDYLEVESPMLQPLAGGALAQPFKTHHNALDMDLYLRIAPELYLKKLLIGGYEKVFELGRSFRNEGIDTTHNPEFTMLEFYEAYGNADSMRALTEKLIKSVIKKTFSKQTLEYNGQKIVFSKKFGQISFFDVLKRHALVTNPENISKEELVLKAKQFGIEVDESDSREKVADGIFGKVCRPKLIQPTFVFDYPLAISPLAKRKEPEASLTDRFQLVAGGLEIANGFSELNDPGEQKERFEDQDEYRKAGDKEASRHDEEYLQAMEYGMPPAGGVGIGIDRFLMLLLDIQNIKEIILFPTMRPKN